MTYKLKDPKLSISHLSLGFFDSYVQATVIRCCKKCGWHIYADLEDHYWEDRRDHRIPERLQHKDCYERQKQ